MFNPDDFPASKQEFMSALDRQFPPKTDEQRAEYRLRRSAADRAPTPVWQWGLAFWALFVAIPFVYWFVSL